MSPGSPWRPYGRYHGNPKIVPSYRFPKISSCCLLYVPYRTLTSMSTKMDTILTGQAALEQRCTQIEARIDSNKNEINEVAKSLEFESAITKDNSSDIKAMRKHIQEQDKALELATDMIQTMVILGGLKNCWCSPYWKCPSRWSKCEWSS